jgi:hypothetical protein
MKTPLILVALLPCLAYGDSTSPSTVGGGVPEPTTELKVMTERLKLSQTQQEQIAPILVAESEKRKSIQDDTALSPQQKHDQMGTVHRAALQQIKACFTPEQLALIEQGQDHPQPSSTYPSTSTTASTN